MRTGCPVGPTLGVPVMGAIVGASEGEFVGCVVGGGDIKIAG